MKTRILFVDDDPNILEGLRRSLRVLRDEWECMYATSGNEALALLEDHDYDVIVSDMRMPNMDGAQLLDEVKARKPSVIRIILSGQSESERIMRAVNSTHAFLSKPCDPASLKDVIENVLKYAGGITDDKVKGFVSRLNHLPSAPASYHSLLQALESNDLDIRTVAQILSGDVGMTAKVLHLANSAFFGLPQRVSDPEVAVMFLGSNTILALALSAHVFAATVEGPLADDINVVLRHSMECSKFARRLAEQHTSEMRIRTDALVAGMLHDCGLVVLMCGYPEFYLAYKETAQIESENLLLHEQEFLGFDHAAVGAYLLGLWGLPGDVVQAVAHHHCPSLSAQTQFTALSAVHLAEVLTNRTERSIEGRVEFDQNYLNVIGLNAELIQHLSLEVPQ
jgi:HD-like signal output (HDOD) protein